MIKIILIVGVVFSFSVLQAKSMVDCRVFTGEMTTCNPYGQKLHYIKEVVYDVDRLKLIIDKTLSMPKRKSIKIISVTDMMKHYKKVEESIRFKGSDTKEKLEKLNLHQSLTAHTSENNQTVKSLIYSVVRGDSLSKIAKKFDLEPQVLAKMNGIRYQSTLRVGQKLTIYLDINKFHPKTYTVQEGDTLLSIARKLHVSAKSLVLVNSIKDATTIHKGRVLTLPFTKKFTKARVKKKKKDRNTFDIRAFGSHSLRVTATAYTSHGNQTDSTPFLAAWNNRLRPGMKSIAVSRDMLTRYGMRNGTKVRIGGLRGYYKVLDKMNKRYKKRIDIYMGLDLKRALRWGRRSVVIYW